MLSIVVQVQSNSVFVKPYWSGGSSESNKQKSWNQIKSLFFDHLWFKANFSSKNQPNKRQNFPLSSIQSHLKNLSNFYEPSRDAFVNITYMFFTIILFLTTSLLIHSGQIQWNETQIKSRLSHQNPNMFNYLKFFSRFIQTVKT